MGHGIAGGSMGGVLQTAVDPNAWNGRWEDVAGRFGTNMAQNGINAGLLSAWQMHGPGGANPGAADGSTTGLPDPASATTVHPDGSPPPVVADPATTTVRPPVDGDPASAHVPLPETADPAVAPVIAADPGALPRWSPPSGGVDGPRRGP